MNLDELFSGFGKLAPDHGAFGRTWPDQPDWWMSSEEEWIVYWFLKHKLKWTEDEDFYYQGRVYVDSLYANQDFTQADFIIDLGPESKVGMIGNLTALVLDPFTEFTHDRDTDFRRWQALADEGYGLIFLASNDVKYRTEHALREAFQGRDISNRGWGVVE